MGRFSKGTVMVDPAGSSMLNQHCRAVKPGRSCLSTARTVHRLGCDEQMRSRMQPMSRICFIA